MINAASLAKMKRGAMLINTSRGGLVDTHAAIAALKSGQLGHLGVDVVEEEGAAFFKYRETEVPDELARLILFNNVIVTGHQAFLTQEVSGRQGSANGCGGCVNRTIRLSRAVRPWPPSRRRPSPTLPPPRPRRRRASPCPQAPR